MDTLWGSSPLQSRTRRRPPPPSGGTHLETVSTLGAGALCLECQELTGVMKTLPSLNGRGKANVAGLLATASDPVPVFITEGACHERDSSCNKLVTLKIGQGQGGSSISNTLTQNLTRNFTARENRTTGPGNPKQKLSHHYRSVNNDDTHLSSAIQTCGPRQCPDMAITLPNSRRDCTPSSIL